jgi:predicted ABC-type ATPase
MADPGDSPSVIILAGPNGAGKSTAAPKILPNLLGIGEFVNADVIAQGLSAFAPERHAIEAGRIMLKRLRALADARGNFAFETTLASRSLAPWLAELVRSQYRFHLFFFYLSTPELAIRRVAQRVRVGGHHVPEETIRRRYDRGLQNFFRIYMPLADTWAIYNNETPGAPRLIASGEHLNAETVEQATLWGRLLSEYGPSNKTRHRGNPSGPDSD